MQRVVANVTASQTDSVLVNGVAGQKIRVLAYTLSTPTATPVTFNSKSGAAGTAISPVISVGANSPVVVPQLNASEGGGAYGIEPGAWFETNTGEGLTATTGTGGTVGILVIYDLG